jgi:putative PIN family toxin of toxin-antitoxin system
MRILYDTNVLVTMLSRREAIIDLKALVSNGTVTIITSSHILSEVEAVLEERMGLTKRKSKSAARLLSRISESVEPTNISRVSRDPFDDYVLAASVQGRVDYLVTSDKDLLVLRDYVGVNIVTPHEFSEILPDHK